MNLEGKIVGERIFLREMDESDISERFVLWLSDPEVTEFLEVRHNPPNLNSQNKYVKECKESSTKAYLGIFQQNEVLIGSVTLNSNETRVEIGLMIGDKSLQGKGFGTEVVKAVSHWAREQGFTEITAGYLQGNKRSARLFESIGFQIVGVIPKSDTIRQDYSVVRTSLSLRA
jgi:ribosomal-protein-alanine N-acetyltransferase